MEYTLDCREMTGRKEAHDYIAEQLSFPAYYGQNLDALYDCLTDMPVSHITLTNIESLQDMGWYGTAILGAFEDAMADNPRLTVDFISTEEE
ncbi:MAG: barstar family protein [Lachnospiraceae bacterium]